MKLLVTSLLCSIAFSTLHAQEKWGDKGEIEDTQVIIEKDRRIELPVANRKFEKVPPIQMVGVKPVFSLSVVDIPIILPQIEPKLRVLTMKPEKLEKIYGNYVKAGAGNFGNTYAEGFFTNKRSENFHYGARVFHNDYLNGPVDERNSGSGQQNVQLFGRAVQDKIAAYGALDYQRNKIHFYGYETAPAEAGDIRRIYNNVKAEAGILNNDLKSEIDYSLDFQANFFSDSDQQSENDFQIAGHFDYKLNEDWEVFFDAETHFTKFSVGEFSQQRNLLVFSPGAIFNLKKLNIIGSLNFIHQNDTLGTNGGGDEFFVFPSIEARYPLTKSISVKGGFKGEVERYTYRQFAYENPFLDILPLMANTVVPIKIYAEFNGNVWEGLGLKLGASLGSYRNMYFYSFSTIDPSSMRIQYDLGRVNMANIYSEIDYSPNTTLNVNLKANYYSYQMDELTLPFHRPDFDVALTSRYNVYQKFVVKTNFWTMGGLQAPDPFAVTPEIIDLPVITRLDLGVEYLFANRSSLFLDFNNLLNRNYERWVNYPARGLHFRIGATYHF